MCKLVSLKSSNGDRIQIAEVKKDVIKGIQKIASDCDGIERIILFGSVLERDCNASSDIDMVIISRVPLAQLSKSPSYRDFKRKLYDIDDEQTYDILRFSSMEQIKKNRAGAGKDILEKGKVIYERMAG